MFLRQISEKQKFCFILKVIVKFFIKIRDDFVDRYSMEEEMQGVIQG